MKKIYTLLVLFITIGYVFMPKISAESNKDTELTKRISQYAKDFPVSLSEGDSALLSERCELIQDKIKEALASITAVTKNRQSNYEYIENKLYSVQSRFSNQKLDTSIIDLMLASYRIEISNFKIQELSYSTILNDAVDQDCKADPEKFNSTVLAARRAREEVQKSIYKIREIYSLSITNGFSLLISQIGEVDGQ